MPQKNYITNKKSLPKLEQTEMSAENSDESLAAEEEEEDSAAEENSVAEEASGVEEEESGAEEGSGAEGEEGSAAEEEEASEGEEESLAEVEVKPEPVEISSKKVETETFSLYVRSAAWIKDRDNAENMLREIEPRIQNVRHPRQKSADFCFIDFASAEDRDQAHEVLKKHPKLTVKPVTKDVPTKLDKRKQKIAEKREAKQETRKLLAKIKKNETKKSNAEKTNQLIISNLPRQTTQAELNQCFPTSVKINLKLKKPNVKSSTAIIMFPSPSDAIAASKSSHVLHGQKLKVFLNRSNSFKHNTKSKSKRKHKQSKQQSDGEPAQKSAKISAE